MRYAPDWDVRHSPLKTSYVVRFLLDFFLLYFRIPIFRYDVHSKLVSFMAPQNVGIMSDQAR